MQHNMEPLVYVPAILSWAALFVQLVTLVLAPAYVGSRIRSILKKETKEIPELVYQLKTERARAAGTMATAARRLRQIERDEYDDGSTDEEEPEPSGLGSLAPMILGLASQLGIDPQKVMAGDPGELAKVQQVLGQLKKPAAGASAEGMVYL